MEKFWFIFVVAYAVSTMLQSWVIIFENVKLKGDNKRLESNNRVLKNHIKRMEEYLKTKGYADMFFI
ncbi:hypothetical protein JMUB5056_1750 [Leptotrichia hongkongensis]|uniref:Uncharacterized protein n=1 Tax=Leptotrichia hongkongensis TaxID=554406 RepID=A0A510L8Q6_9FUSO|nr:hypothetical protein [Leptotrichia hongkongensis]BBM60156.1 hypothetical protein JMUB5056_1750 [Leptotrichia hongkongensis]